jgi:hypothetical protein
MGEGVGDMGEGMGDMGEGVGDMGEGVGDDLACTGLNAQPGPFFPIQKVLHHDLILGLRSPACATQCVYPASLFLHPACTVLHVFFSYLILTSCPPCTHTVTPAKKASWMHSSP